jgi:hypothetical protein
VAFNTDTESYAGDDPSGAGDTGVGYGSTSMDTGGNETDGSVLSQAGFNSAMNITSKNPFGDAGFFTSVFGIDPKSIDYSNIFSADEREAIANQQYGLYSNPQNQPGFGYNPNVPTVTTGVREGLTRGFGSLFGSPVGTPTTRGTVQAQRAADPLGSVMRGAFALAAPPFSLPSLAAQNLGKDTYTTSLAPDYDPTKDPNSPSYTGPSSMGGIVDALSMLGTGMTSTTAQEVYGATKEAVEEAIDYFSNPKGGSIQIQDAFSTDRSPGMMNAVFGPEVASTLGGLTVDEAMDLSGITDPSQTGTINYDPNSNKSMERQLSDQIEDKLDLDVNKGIFSLYEAQDAKRAMGGYETFNGQRI